MRLFAAIDLTDSARASIGALQRALRAGPGGAALRWVRPELMHLTLVFAGDVDEERGAAAADALAAPLPQAPFSIDLSGIGVFPPRGSPRILWLGVAHGADDVGSVRRLAADRLAGVGIAGEDRPFHPHLTLGRWRDGRPADRRRVLDRAHEPAIVARVDVRVVTLYRSELGASGPSYTALAHAPLLCP
jgi:2'-5' RNA ligase